MKTMLPLLKTVAKRFLETKVFAPSVARFGCDLLPLPLQCELLRAQRIRPDSMGHLISFGNVGSNLPEIEGLPQPHLFPHERMSSNAASNRDIVHDSSPI
jgi:hypothetical protein